MMVTVVVMPAMMVTVAVRETAMVTWPPPWPPRPTAVTAAMDGRRPRKSECREADESAAARAKSTERLIT